MKIEEALRKKSSECKEYEKLIATWELNKETIAKLLDCVIIHYPHFSLHNASHSETVIKNVEKILGDDGVSKLSPSDLWLILHAAYLHDIGMVIKYNDLINIINSDDFKDFVKEYSLEFKEDISDAAVTVNDFINENGKISWDDYFEIEESISLIVTTFFRRKHANMSKEYINKFDIGEKIDLSHNEIIIKRFINIIAEICEKHTMNFSEVLRLPIKENGYNDDYIHPRMVACLIRLGDALDMDNGRFLIYGEQIFGKMPVSSKIHKDKHESVKHILIDSERIEIVADCSENRVYREIRSNIECIKNEINNININWNNIIDIDIKHFPQVEVAKIYFDGDEILSDYQNLEFNISNRKAFEIVEGSGIYSEKVACLREVIQNAEDALKIQLWRDIKNVKYAEGIDKGINDEIIHPKCISEKIYSNYKISIEIKSENEKAAIVKVYDNGTGIFLETLKRICNVGNPDRIDLKDMPIWLRPTAGFGIGLQSCFLVGNKFKVLTKPQNDNNSYEIEFESAKYNGYISVKKSKNYAKIGTEIVLRIPNENFSYTFSGYVDENIRDLDPLMSNCAIVYKIIEYIYQECRSSFFPIEIKCDELNIDDIIKPLEFSKLDINKENAILKYLDNGNGLYWYNNNCYKILINTWDHPNISLLFKGKLVEKAKTNWYEYIGLSIEIDLYGFETKEALNLNRKELKPEIYTKVYKDLEVVVKDFLSSIRVENIKGEGDILYAKMKNICFLKNKLDININHDILNKFGEVKIKYLKNDGEQLKDSYTSLKNINDSIEKVYYIKKTYSENSDEIYDKLKEHYKQINDLIIKDEHLSILFSYLPHKYIFLNENADLCLCQVIKNDGLYCVNEYTKKCFIKSLVYNRIDGVRVWSYTVGEMRMVIPAFDEYKKIAVKIKNFSYYGILYRAKTWYIISPITRKDLLDIKEKRIKCDVFISEIVKRDDFIELINYTLENNKTYYDNNVKLSKKEIENEYIRLIKEYFDLEKIE